jgi:hypothetical protein
MMRKMGHMRARMMPEAVATPLPPLKPRKIERMCPMTGVTATSTVSHGGSRSEATYAGTKPLAVSQTRTSDPARDPRRR